MDGLAADWEKRNGLRRLGRCSDEFGSHACNLRWNGHGILYIRVLKFLPFFGLFSTRGLSLGVCSQGARQHLVAEGGLVVLFENSNYIKSIPCDQ